MNIFKIHITLILMLAGTLLQAQQEIRHIRQGNRHYEDADYKKAEIEYIKSLQSAKTADKGFYNLGDALYMQNNYLQAAAAFDTLRTFRMDDKIRAKTYYNLGNSLLKLAIDSAQVAGQALAQSIDSYKNSLRLDPADTDAKYNLAYAQKMLEKMQQQQQQQNQDQQQKQDQQKQDQEQKEQEQNQEQQQKDELADQQQQQQQQSKPQEISKEDAERILEALKNDEKQTLEKLKQAQIKMTRVVKSEKDW